MVTIPGTFLIIIGGYLEVDWFVGTNVLLPCAPRYNKEGVQFTYVPLQLGHKLGVISIQPLACV